MKHNVAKIKAQEIQKSFMLEYPLNLHEFCECIGIRIIDYRSLHVDGYLCKDGSNKYIFVNADLNERQKNFVIAHELGHYFLHTDKILQICSGIIKGFDGHQVVATAESEANQFAAELLLPTECIKKEVSRLPLSFEKIAEISDKYSVSLTSAAIKCVECSSTENEMLICYKNKYVQWVAYPPHSPFFVKMGSLAPHDSAINRAFDENVSCGGSCTAPGVWSYNSAAKETFITITPTTKLLLLSAM